MDQSKRVEIEARAHRLWLEAGSPEGREAAYRDLAEAELQQSVDAAVPDSERLPSGAAENPLSEHVAEVAAGAHPGPGKTSLEGGDKVT